MRVNRKGAKTSDVIWEAWRNWRELLGTPATQTGPAALDGELPLSKMNVRPNLRLDSTNGHIESHSCRGELRISFQPSSLVLREKGGKACPYC